MNCLFVPKQWMNIYKENENIICSKSLRLGSWKVFIKIGAFWLPYFSEVWCLSPIFWLWNCSLINSECPVLDTLTPYQNWTSYIGDKIHYLGENLLITALNLCICFSKKRCFNETKGSKMDDKFFFSILDVLLLSLQV